jgi:2-keto-4-pentenoate hydratase/2-oxohepta-3-ene-1,7-dioic acid hydratase in catechol pathway
MLLFNYAIGGRPRIGYRHGEQLYDLGEALERKGVIGGGAGAAIAEGSLSALIAAAALNDPRIVEAASAPGAAAIDPSAITLRSPVDRPQTIVGVGRNYGAHAAEGGLERQEKPRLFFKLPSSVIASGEAIMRPAGVTKLDWEAELAVVIGRRAKSVSEAEALGFVAGYTALNDISAREFQFDVSPPQTSFAKSMDGFCPVGPMLLAASSDVDPAGFTVRSYVNGEMMQEGHTHDLIFSIPYLIGYISRYLTLQPGDVIATGTPAGVGHFRKPPVYLRPGDRVTVEIPSIGRLENSVAEDVQVSL